MVTAMSAERAGRPVVTISAPYGAGGSEVGPRLAERLAVPFVDRAIPVAVSDRLAVPLEQVLAREEPPQGTLSGLMAYLVPATLAVYGQPVSRELAEPDQGFREATEQVLHEYAATGAVILGRGAAVVLRDIPHATHVRLHGPRDRRVIQAMRAQGIDRVTAERQMHAADLSREAYVRHWYRVDPRDPGLYHMVIDSTAISLELCVELITLASAARLQPPATANRG
jgi:cytidylate kinase